MITIVSPPSRLAVLVFGFVLGTTFGILPIGIHCHKQGQEQANIYGQALTESTAREAVEAAFDKDLVSLRAILQATANNQYVLQASIYDVENQLLVQAGVGSAELPESTLLFHSEIALHNNIAGSVSITTTTRSEPYAMLAKLYGLSYIACLLFLLVSLYRGRHLQVLNKPSTDVDEQRYSELNISAETEEDNEGGPEPIAGYADSNTASAEAEHANSQPIGEYFEPEPNAADHDEISTHSRPTMHSAYVGLNIKNIASLKQQLNGETFRRTFSKLERLIDNVGLLYGSSKKEWVNGRYVVQYTALNRSEALFNAACAARLMLDLAGVTNRVPLDLSAQVSFTPDNVSHADMPFVGLAVDPESEHDSDISNKVEFIELGEQGNSHKLIAQFCSPYGELLQKQIAQFRES